MTNFDPTFAFYFLIVASLFLAFGWLWTYLSAQKKLAGLTSSFNSAQEKLSDLLQELSSKDGLLQSETNKCLTLEKDKAGLEADLRNLQEQLERTRNDQETLKTSFESLADKILQQKADQIDNQQRKSLEKILNPLKENIHDFRKRVDQTNQDSVARDSALKEQLRQLAALNQQMSKEAQNLTKALKGDVKQQGTWGEIILENLLQHCGLEKDREYQLQPSLVNGENRRQRPDVTVHMPDGKAFVIDSKVSLTAYERLVSATEEDAVQNHLKDHVRSVKRHINNLAEKNYHDLLEESPDFVMLFIPIDRAFAMALSYDPELYEYAFGKNVVIVTPASLLATLKTVESLWRNDKQHRHAIEIATEAGKMYDKFVGFCHDLLEVGRRLNQTQNAYEGAMNKLTEGKGNLLGKAEKLKDMGAKTTKTLPMSTKAENSDKNEAA